MGPMEKRFIDYGQRVCQFIRHATPKEKAAIQAELAAHITDHTAALIATGHAPETAQAMALEAMGDPEVVGKALNKEYPLRWLVLSRGLLAAIVVLALLLVVHTSGWVQSLTFYWQARTDPLHAADTQLYDAEYNPLPNSYLTPLDLHYSLPGNTVFSIYAVAVVPNGEGTYTVTLFTTRYRDTPLPLTTLGLSAGDLSFSQNGEPLNVFSGMGNTKGSACYFQYSITVTDDKAPLQAVYDHYGTYFAAEIPLTGEEDAP